MKALRIQSPTDFDSTLTQTLTSSPAGTRVFVVVFGTEQKETNESWCPDCVVADPLIRRWIMKVEGSVLLEAPAGERAVWRDPAHLYRTHPQLQTKAIPTLYEFALDSASGKPVCVKKLVEEEAANEDLLAKFIQ
ncbi:Thioredoxin domain-containing protein 17 [Chytridiales sp. JEL 0842]|nr:Thioredoxin domain-containing protein 17 [Chytridiales sp. JEL 0842]